MDRGDNQKQENDVSPVFSFMYNRKTERYGLSGINSITEFKGKQGGGKSHVINKQYGLEQSEIWKKCGNAA